MVGERSRSRCIRSERPTNSSHGGVFVVVCGVHRYCNRKLLNLWESDRSSPRLAFMAFLNVCTSLSAKPFDAGWYGEQRMCFTPFFLQKVANSSEVNCGPLSLTNCVGKPWAANRRLISVMVCVDVSFL